MYLDLSRPINEQTPVFPGDPTIKIEPAGIFQNDGYSDHLVSIGTHVGTHIDAPAHMLDGGKTLDQIPIENFIGRGIYIELKNKVFDIDDVRAAGIEEGDIVLFNTGMDTNYNEPSYFEDYPSVSEEIAHYLVGKQVKMVGFDMCSPDHKPFPVHKILLGNEVLIIENLTNLGQLATKEFTIYALPLSLQLDGAPIRVVANID